jgi:ribosome-associated translation inhibitor RaiA
MPFGGAGVEIALLPINRNPMEMFMHKPLQITFHGLAPSEFVERRIREKAAELERFCDTILGCHVTVESAFARHRQGNLYTVRVHLHLPHDEIVVTRARPHDASHEDVYVAMRVSFDAAIRRVEDYVRRRRDVRPRADVRARA